MRSRLRVTLLTLAAMVVGITGALAGPTSDRGYEIEIVKKDGAIFSGLAQEGGTLLLTDLADGRLYRRDKAGRFQAFGPTLPHGIDVIGDPTGPYHVAPFGKFYLVSQGWTPVDNKEAPYDHALLEIDDTSVRRIVHRDFWNPFDFVVDGDAFIVVDAGRNTVERVTQAGDKTTLFEFPRLKREDKSLQTLSPTEFSGKKPYEVDAVPTGLAEHEGRLYVSLFGGFPYVEGGGVIVSLDKGGVNAQARLEADGLDTPVGIAFDAAGRLLILEHGRFGQATGFVAESGRLVSVDLKIGDRQVLATGLTRPVSVLVLDDGRIVIAQLDGTLIFLTRKSPT
jgi:hypothetical protein